MAKYKIKVHVALVECDDAVNNELTNHSIFHENQRQYNKARDIFVDLQGVEVYKTIGFKDIAMIYGDTEKSYRKTAKLINRPAQLANIHYSVY